jgi:hypothetical protein
MDIVSIAKEFLPAWMPLWVIPLFPVAVGFVATFWARIQALYSRLSTYMISIVKLDADLSAEIMTYLGSVGTVSRLGSQGYMIMSRYVRSKRKQTWVLTRWIDKEGDMTFWIPWKNIKVPVWVKRGADGTHMSFRFVRGTLPMLELLVNTVSSVNTRKSNRYRLVRVGGSRVERGANGQPVAAADRNGVFTDKPSTAFYLPENSNDIGDPNHSGGPADLWLPESLDNMLSDARQWSRNREWYMEHRLPWRRGYMLYGLPGTGKTSIARAIGIDLDIPIFAFDIQSMANSDLTSAFEQARQSAPCIVLIEDIDSVYNARTSSQPNTQLGTPPSFDLLLNHIQGVGSNDGVMVIITTNHLDTIDQALGGPAVQEADGTIIVGELRPRPGRIDRLVRTPDVIDLDGRLQLASRMIPGATDLAQLMAETENMTPAQYQDVLLSKAQERL